MRELLRVPGNGKKRVRTDINIEEIAKAIVKLKENPKLCQELEANARKAYEQRYSKRIMEQRPLALYEELLDQTR